MGRCCAGSGLGCVSPHPNPRGAPFEWVKNLVFLRVSSWSFVCLRGQLFFFLLFQTSRAPAPYDGADHSRVKQRINVKE